MTSWLCAAMQVPVSSVPTTYDAAVDSGDASGPDAAASPAELNRFGFAGDSNHQTIGVIMKQAQKYSPRSGCGWFGLYQSTSGIHQA